MTSQLRWRKPEYLAKTMAWHQVTGNFLTCSHRGSNRSSGERQLAVSGRASVYGRSHSLVSVYLEKPESETSVEWIISLNRQHQPGPGRAVRQWTSGMGWDTCRAVWDYDRPLVQMRLHVQKRLMDKVNKQDTKVERRNAHTLRFDICHFAFRGCKKDTGPKLPWHRYIHWIKSR